MLHTLKLKHQGIAVFMTAFIILFLNKFKHTSDIEDMFYVLLWTPSDWEPFNHYNGRTQFLKNNCSHANCFVTGDRSFFGGDLSKFHAIAFNGRNLPAETPATRSQHQKFIYVNEESSGHRSNLFLRRYNDFFNWTMTFRLDSDIPCPYLIVRNPEGAIVGPKIDMHWKQDIEDVSEEFAETLKTKTKAAAWFASNCRTTSKREKYASELQKQLKLHGHILDIFGACGPLKCPRNEEDCNILVRKDYYFYLAFENSFSEDYVTEKVLRALNNNAVPIVYGGANYSRFLPPNSYLNAREHSPIEMANIIKNIIDKPEYYKQFFKWKSYYTYPNHNPMDREHVCYLCSAFNEVSKYKTISVYHDIWKWWKRCYKRQLG